MLALGAIMAADTNVCWGKPLGAVLIAWSALVRRAERARWAERRFAAETAGSSYPRGG